MTEFSHSSLPVDEALPRLASALAAGRNAVLGAPPGSGKTTRIPLALMDQPWLQGRRILMLEPRRLAARAAARFMAGTLGETVGQRVGYRVRMDSRVSEQTRVEVLTEGVLTRRLQQDPELDGVGLVIFDEFHERSLQADLGLALCLEVQQGLREDLRLLVMSATLDAQPLLDLLGNAEEVRAEGRSHPVQTFYDPAQADRSIAAEAVRGVSRALDEQDGDLLVFLPGVGEIRQAESALRERLAHSDILVCPLYGDLDAAAQDRAIRPDPDGRRRVVLATAIAETSLTIEGVRVVIDTGWSRLPRFDPNNGLTRLLTERESQAAAEQRRGRAGRLGPGSCYRLWPESLALKPHSPPEISQADLAPLLLELALWGVDDPGALAWLDPPPPGPLAQARDLLLRLEALDGSGRITALGRRMAGLPLHPRLAHMLLRAADAGAGRPAADLAALLSEKDIFRRRHGEPLSRDLDERLTALSAWRSDRRANLPQLDAGACRRVDQVSGQLQRLLGKGGSTSGIATLSTGQLVALAYPDRIAQRRAAGGFRLANGRGALLDEQDPLAAADLLAVAAMDAGVRDGRVFLAGRLSRSELEALYAERIETRATVAWDGERRAVGAWRETRLDALLLERKPLQGPPPEQVSAALLEGIRQGGLDCLPWTPQARELRSRVLCLRDWDSGGGWPDLSDAALLRELDEWLLPWLNGLSSLDQLRRLDLASILRQGLDWQRQKAMDELAPQRLPVPSGALRPLEYRPGEPPVLAVRLQEMFGLRETPSVCRGTVPVLLHLLSPARRPLQVTQDLAGFWDRTYAEVRKEMKGRYPKHYWPEDPREAVPTSRVRPEGKR